MREIKFRAWDKERKVMSEVRSWDFAHGDIELGKERQPYADLFEHEAELMQYTGLKDKNGNGGQEVYEGDIIDGDGKVKGNICEMDAGEVDLVIADFGGRDWCNTYKEAVARGLTHSK